MVNVFNAMDVGSFLARSVLEGREILYALTAREQCTCLKKKALKKNVIAVTEQEN